ncbi:MAG: helix-turn-helix transcriptional regulator [Chloroflexi bacterium]|nr:helix-turn-helix transcriptional regulator [Chloroflexota bacterium]
MASVDGGYGERFSHATVSRWEAGTVRPSVDRIKTFGAALNLSDTETAGLILLAGLAPDMASASSEVGMVVKGAVTDNGPADAGSRLDASEVSPDPGTDDERSILGSLGRLMLLRILPLAVFIVGAGHGLGALGWNANWMPIAYVCVTTALVLAQGLLGPDRTAGLRDFFWVSLFFALAVPTLQFAPLDMDHFGFYAMRDFYGTHMPYMLTLLVCLATAGLGGVMFHLLGRWTNQGNRGRDGVVGRTVWAVLPPILVSYVVVMVLSNISVWIQSAVVFAVLGGIMGAVMVLQDPSVNPTPGQRRFLLPATFASALVLSIAGMLTIFIMYVSPDVPRILPDHNLLGSWEIDFEALGYTREEVMARLDSGYVWHAMFLFVYMVFCVGGKLLKVVYVLADDDSAGPDAVLSDASNPATTGSSPQSHRLGFTFP